MACMNIFFFHLIFPGANIFLVLRPLPPPISFLMVRPLLLAILPIHRCEQCCPCYRSVRNSEVSARRELTVLCKQQQQQQQQNDIKHFPQTFFNKVIDFIVTGISFHERQRSIYSGAALKNFFLPNAALIRGR